MAATEPIRDKNQLKQLAKYFLTHKKYRNYALIVLGTCTALRISDLLKLTWHDVYDEKRQSFRSHVFLVEGKTGKAKTIALNKQAMEALLLLYKRRRENSGFIFANNRADGRAISRVQAWRIIHNAVLAIGIRGKISCHSLRKTWGYHAWISAKVSPVVIMDILNHSSYETTKRYLGVAQDDLDRAYKSMALF